MLPDNAALWWILLKHLVNLEIITLCIHTVCTADTCTAESKKPLKRFVWAVGEVCVTCETKLLNVGIKKYFHIYIYIRKSVSIF